MRTTHNNAEAVAWGILAAHIIAGAAGGGSVSDAVTEALPRAPPALRAAVEDALASAAGGAEDTAAFAGRVGRACNMKWGIPVAVHAMLCRGGGGSFITAVRDNALAGGDSCGRGLFIGAVMGAAGGVPVAWQLRAAGAGAAEARARAIAGKRAR